MHQKKFTLFSIIKLFLICGVLFLSGCQGNTYGSKPSLPVSSGRLPSNYSAEVNKIGLLLPLTGSQQSVGQSMLNAAQMAVFDSQSSLVLLSEDTNNGSSKAFQKSIDQGADVILGPVFSTELSEIKNTSQNRLPVFSFSNDSSQATGNTYVLGISPVDQVKRILSYAKAQGKERFAALIPNTAYGNLIVNALPSEVIVQRYNADMASLSDAVKELSLKMQNVNALLIAEGGTTLRQLASLLSYNDVNLRKVQLLGTDLWDRDGVGKEPTLKGGWYVAATTPQKVEFEQRYKQLYQKTPGRLDSMMYDAVMLMQKISNFRNGETFTGLNGPMHLKQDGQIEWGLSVLEVTNASPRVLDSSQFISVSE